jgi:hypothetical protein
MKVAFFALFIGACSASYPLSYPFENEGIEIPAPREATPSWTFDGDDPGGYVYAYGYNYVPTETPFCFTEVGKIAHHLVGTFEAPPVLPDTLWNCTAREYPLNADTYLYEVNGATIGNSGACSDFYGQFAYFGNEPSLGDYEGFAADLEAGLCENYYNDGAFCLLFSMAANWACFEHFEVLGERQYMYPCYDSMYQHLMQCAAFRTAGYWSEFFIKAEPEEYINDSTVPEQLAWFGVYNGPDRVCNPYSYYFPETAKGTSSSESAGSADDSSSGIVAVLFAVLLALMM